MPSKIGQETRTTGISSQTYTHARSPTLSGDPKSLGQQELKPLPDWSPLSGPPAPKAWSTPAPRERAEWKGRGGLFSSWVSTAPLGKQETARKGGWWSALCFFLKNNHFHFLGLSAGKQLQYFRVAMFAIMPRYKEMPQSSQLFPKSSKIKKIYNIQIWGDYLFTCLCWGTYFGGEKWRECGGFGDSERSKSPISLWWCGLLERQVPR